MIIKFSSYDDIQILKRQLIFWLEIFDREEIDFLLKADVFG